MRYIVKVGDKSRGPFTSKQLREMADSGQLSPDDQIRKESDSQWYAAHKFKGLFGTADSNGDARAIAPKPKPSRTSKTRRSSKRSTNNPLLIGAVLLVGIACVGAVILYLGSKPSVARRSSEPVGQQT